MVSLGGKSNPAQIHVFSIVRKFDLPRDCIDCGTFRRMQSRFARPFRQCFYGRNHAGTKTFRDERLPRNLGVFDHIVENSRNSLL
jgi:hypothetical protein